MTMLSREDPFRGQWVNPPGTLPSGREVVSRECESCGFTGPDVEFVAVSGTDVPGQLVMTPIDEAPELSEVWCVGCAVQIGPEAVVGLLTRFAELRVSSRG